MKHHWMKASAAAAATVALAAGGLVLAAPSAQAAQVGTLHVGLTTNPPPAAAPDAFSAAKAVTNTGCPASATNFVLMISGGKLGSTPVNINGNNSLDTISATPGQTAPMEVPFAVVLDQLRVDHGLAALNPGTYTITFRCRAKFAAASLGDLVGTLKITQKMTATAKGRWEYAKPTVTGKPVLTGAARVGGPLTCATTQKTASGTTRLVTFANYPASLRYQWLRGASVVATTSTATYAPTVASLGKTLACRVVGTNSYGAATSGTSAAKKIALGAAIKAVKKPVITGTPSAGKTLTVTKGTWKPTPAKYAFTWKVGTKVVANGSKTRYVVKSGDKGKKITVVVKVTKPGYAPGSTTTNAVTVK